MFEMLTAPTIERAQWKSRLHGPKPQPSNLFFTEAWPGTHKWCSGKYFEIKETVVLSYSLGYRLPGNDQKNLDLSNTADGLKLYPESDGIAYEILVGLKPGNYQISVYIPGVNDYLLALGDTSMYPDLADAVKRHLAVITPEDSPFDNPLLKLWTINDMASWILKIDMLPGVDFDSAILVFKIAKHKLAEISKPDVFTTIKYFTEYKGTW